MSIIIMTLVALMGVGAIAIVAVISNRREDEAYEYQKTMTMNYINFKLNNQIGNGV